MKEENLGLNINQEMKKLPSAKIAMKNTGQKKCKHPLVN